MVPDLANLGDELAGSRVVINRHGLPIVSSKEEAEIRIRDLKDKARMECCPRSR